MINGNALAERQHTCTILTLYDNIYSSEYISCYLLTDQQPKLTKRLIYIYGYTLYATMHSQNRDITFNYILAEKYRNYFKKGVQ